MALYLKTNPKLVVASDSAYKQKIWERIDESLNQVVRTDLTEHSTGRLKLDPSGGSTPSATIPMGGVTTGKVIQLFTDLPGRYVLLSLECKPCGSTAFTIDAVQRADFMWNQVNTQGHAQPA